MPILKNKYFTIALLVFLITIIPVATGTFQSAVNRANDLQMDHLFFYTINILFWFSAAFLVNSLLRYFIWGKVLSVPAGARAMGYLEDFVVTFVYLMVAVIVLPLTFGAGLSSSLVIIFLLLLLFISILRPKIIQLFSKALLSSTRPFKPGDWIRLMDKTGSNSICGEVIEFDRLSVRLRTEDDTLMLFPNALLDEYIIENFRGLQKEVRFSVSIKLNLSAGIERAKRILLSGTKHALLTVEGGNVRSPRVLVDEIQGEKVAFRIIFYIAPWQGIAPEDARDLVITRVYEHLRIAGLEPDTQEWSERIFANVGLFSSLSPQEIEMLHKTSGKFFYPEGTAIIRQGDKGNSMYVLAEGLLSVFVKTDGSGSQDIKVGSIAPGEFFGEMSLFTGEDRSATVISETDAVVYEVTKESVRNIISSKPVLVDEFGKIIAERQSVNLIKLDEYKNRKDSFIEKIIGKIKSWFEI